MLTKPQAGGLSPDRISKLERIIELGKLLNRIKEGKAITKSRTARIMDNYNAAERDARAEFDRLNAELFPEPLQRAHNADAVMLYAAGGAS